jgi:hypothetical protein
MTMSDDDLIKLTDCDLDDWSLDLVPRVLYGQFHKAIAARDAHTMLSMVPDLMGLEFVRQNAEELRRAGIYEKALLTAFVGSKPRNCSLGANFLHVLFDVHTDRGHLRTASAALPGTGPFILYRGVSGHGAARRIRGRSWTPSLERAKRFARLNQISIAPAVYRVTAPAEWIVAYIYNQEEDEQEFLLELPPKADVERVWRAAADDRNQISTEDRDQPAGVIPVLPHNRPS